MAGSWRPPNSEVHGLAPHGRAVRSSQRSLISRRHSGYQNLAVSVLERSVQMLFFIFGLRPRS